MIKHVYVVASDNQNPLFQLHYLRGRIHIRDYAFYMRKLAFIQFQKNTPEKKYDNHTNNG
jgi:hypothetical protein